MGWKRFCSCCWKGTGVCEGFSIEFHRRASRNERSYYRVLHNGRLLGLAQTRFGANHCADEYSRLLLFERLGMNEPNLRPSLIGDAIWFQGRVLHPDEQAGLNWVFEAEGGVRHRRFTYLDWEEAWQELTGSKPPTK